jgi:hypothetical protein
MRRRRLQFGIGSLLLLTAACAVGTQWLRGPVIRATIEPAGFATADDGEHYTRFRMTNTGAESIWYTGNTRAGAWHLSDAVIQDGKPVRRGPVPIFLDLLPSEHELKPGRTEHFHVRTEPETTKLRAGLVFGTRPADPDRFFVSPNKTATGPIEEVTRAEIWSPWVSVPDPGAAGHQTIESSRPR